MVDEKPETQDDTPEKDSETSQKRKKRPGEIVRERALYGASFMIIVYPLVGAFLGWVTVEYLGWPFWVILVMMIAGFVQGIREIFRLSKKTAGNNDENSR